MKPRLFVFDVGGVFRDSSVAINEGFRRGFLSHGLNYNFSPDDVWHLRGIGRYNSSRECIKVLYSLAKTGENLHDIINSADAEEILERAVKENVSGNDEGVIENIRRVYKEYFRSPEAKKLIRILPDAKHCVEKLFAHGYRLAIFTNSSVSSVKRDLRGFGLEKFSAIVSEEDVKSKKPSGEGIAKIMEILHTKPFDTIYVGDSVVDIRAARDAGCRCAVVLTGMALRIHLERERPDYIFGNLSELCRRFS